MAREPVKVSKPLGLRGANSNQPQRRARAGSHALDPLDATRRKLLYRSKQRGWLEMDIMLGNWAAANLPRLQEAELQRSLPSQDSWIELSPW